MKLKRLVATLLTVVVLMGLLPIISLPAIALTESDMDWHSADCTSAVDTVMVYTVPYAWPFAYDGAGPYDLGKHGGYLSYWDDALDFDMDNNEDHRPIMRVQAYDIDTASHVGDGYGLLDIHGAVLAGEEFRRGVVPLNDGEITRNHNWEVAPRDLDGLRRDAESYVAFGLYNRWVLWNKFIWQGRGEGSAEEFLESLGTIPSLNVRVYTHCAEGDLNVTWEEPGYSDVSIQDIFAHIADYNMLINGESGVIKAAFGEEAYTLFTGDENLYGCSDFEDKRSQLAFMHLLFDHASGTCAGANSQYKLGLRLQSQEEQKAAYESQVDTVYKDIAESTNRTFSESVWLAQYAAYTGSKSVDDYYTLMGTTNAMQALPGYDEIVAGGATFDLNNTDMKAGGTNGKQLIANAYAMYHSVKGDIPVSGWPHDIRDGTELPVTIKSLTMRLRPYILSAASQLKTQCEEFDGDTSWQASGSDIQQIQYFVLKMYVTYGVMSGVLDESYLDYVYLSTQENDCLYAPAPAFLAWPAENNAISYKGFYAFVVTYNEFRKSVFLIVNGLAPYMTNPNLSLDNVHDYTDSLLMLQQMLYIFDDPEMWKTWNDSRMDGTNNAEKHSLADVYDFLVAQHVFDAEINAGEDGTKGNNWSYFFNKDEGKLSNSMLTGIKQSAMFLPMRTNVYDPATWKDGVDKAWLLNYYAKFGYFRKALYIDTGADAAVTYGNTGGRGQLAVATLEDMLQDKDIVLYLDDNLYNVNTLSELIGKSWDRLGQSAETNDQDNLERLGSLVTNLWEVSMPELAKTAERTTYSGRLNASDANDEETTWGGLFFHDVTRKEQSKLQGTESGSEAEEAEATETTETAEKADEKGSTDADKATNESVVYYQASDKTDNISYYLYPDSVWDSDQDQVTQLAGGATPHTTEYTPLFGFAVLSAIYKDDSLKNTLNNQLSANTPVFVSSASAPYVCDSLKTSIYNYMLVRNIESQIPVDYTTSLDMTSPLYMDIFGNILTESGYVVIPAAANATLWANTYVPRNAAFFSCYGDSYRLEYHDTEEAKAIDKLLTQGKQPLCRVDEERGVYVLNALRTTDGTVNSAMLSTASKDALMDIADTFAINIKSSKEYSLNKWKMIITEVLRGAPIENIDKQFEGIQTDVNYTRNGLIIADKLETLCNAIAPAGQNASLAIPNPAFIDGIEIIVFFIYKLLILGVLVIWMITVYLDAVAGSVGWKTGAKCIGTVVLVLALIVGVPKIFELSYYESNKLLLQDETEYLLMLNTEKEANGQEIGVAKVRPPDTNTTLYLHLADIDMPWWDLLPKIGLSSGYKALDEMYKDYTNRHPLAYTEFATTMNDGIYISTEQLFDSAKVQFSPLSKRLFVSGDDNTPASYYTPYYFFLYSIVEEVSDWSREKNAIAYTTKVQKGGELKTLGYCKLYFESEDFMEEGGDFFHLYQIYNVPSEKTQDPVGEDAIAQLRESQWCAWDVAGLSDKAYVERIKRLQDYAIAWIANNHDMIGRVSDETFLKCFALSCAMEHNRLFNTQRADYLEIQELSNEDLLRLSIADHNKVMSNSSMSYARFVYSTGGTISCYLAAILELVNLASSWIKPACTLLVFCIACISIFVLKLILRRGNSSILGYILTVALMCSVNVLGAGVNKLSMYLPNTGLTPALCILAQILVQIVYIFLQVKIVSFAMRDWRNVGFQHYEHQFNKIHLGRRSPMLSVNVNHPRGITGYQELDRLTNQHIARRLRK